ncbi:MAG: glycosyltransferase family 4 protein [Bacteroidales bacterium]|jgi:glycosyltransferase involved in cell wall biosynthesis|nr:glycosyltransferase family 4 protein [Bacteroidales bacterium]
MDKEFETLLNTYQRMFGMIDVIHFNSQNTADAYNQYIKVPKGSSVVSIIHNGIRDCRQSRLFDQKKLRLGFIGSVSPFKGLPILKRVIEKMNSHGYNDRIELSVYCGQKGKDVECTNVTYKGRYSATQMAAVYNSMDLLVVPSICYETFGFIVLEAIQYGVPVLVSSKVGAKDVVNQYAPQFVFETENDLLSILCRLIDNREELVAYNKKIIELPWQWSMKKHAEEIVDKFYGS